LRELTTISRIHWYNNYSYYKLNQSDFDCTLDNTGILMKVEMQHLGMQKEI